MNDDIVVRLPRGEYAMLVDWLAQLRAGWFARGKALSPMETTAMRAVLAAGSHTGTALDSPVRAVAAWDCTTQEASQRLGITPRAVRKAIARGALTARQATDRGPYVIDEQSIAAFAQRRAARAA